MLQPDVWSFPAPTNITVSKAGVWNDKSEQAMEEVLKRHPFHEIVSILVPGKCRPPGVFNDLLRESDFYEVKGFKLKDFLRKEFVKGFVYRGKFSGLGFDTNDDLGDCFALKPSGTLVLVVQRNIYLSLGLDCCAKPNIWTKNDKYYIKINLLDPKLRGGTKYYARLEEALSSDLLPELNLKFAWDPPDGDTCPSSAAKYFNDIGYQVDLHETQVNTSQEFGLQFPIFHHVKFNDKTVISEFLETVGMAFLGCDYESIVSSFKLTGTTDNINTGRIVHCKGLFSSEYISKLIKTLWISYRSEMSQFPWIAINVNGFPNSTINFINNGYGFSNNAATGFILFLYSDGSYYCWNYCGTMKIHKK